MSLIKCPECGKENVSDSAEVCPRCGFTIKKYYENEINKGCIIKEQEKKKSVHQEKLKKRLKLGFGKKWNLKS